MMNRLRQALDPFLLLLLATGMTLLVAMLGKEDRRDA